MLKVLIISLCLSFIGCGKSGSGRTNTIPGKPALGPGEEPATGTLPLFTDYKVYEGKVSYDTLNFRLSDVLQKSADLNDYFLMNSSKFEIFASLENKNSQNPDLSITLGDTALSLPPYHFAGGTEKLILKDLKVALDPKYIGGELAINHEQRYVDFLSVDGQTEEEILFSEAEINYYVARILKQKLESMGAIVLLTKRSPHEQVYEKDYKTWKEK